jgi:hypothetical protein
MTEPLVIMYADGARVVCRVHPDPDIGHRHYGVLLVDLVREVARAYGVEERAVWWWVDRERRAPTGPGLDGGRVQ